MKIRIEKDKALRCLVAFVIAVVVAALYKLCGSTAVDASGLAWITTFVICIGKMVYKEEKCGGSDSRDWLVEVVGNTIGSLFAFLLIM